MSDASSIRDWEPTDGGRLREPATSNARLRALWRGGDDSERVGRPTLPAPRAKPYRAGARATGARLSLRERSVRVSVCPCGSHARGDHGCARRPVLGRVPMLDLSGGVR